MSQQKPTLREALGKARHRTIDVDDSELSRAYEVVFSVEDWKAVVEVSQQSNPATLREADMARAREAAKTILTVLGCVQGPEQKGEPFPDDVEKVAQIVSLAASGTEAAPSERSIAICKAVLRKIHEWRQIGSDPDVLLESRNLHAELADEMERVFDSAEPAQAAASPEGEWREADLRQHIANLLMVYRTALRFIKTCHEQKAWPKDLPVTEESSNVIERAEAALRQSAAPSGDLEREAMRLAAMDACTGAQWDGGLRTFTVRELNKIVCAVADEIEALSDKQLEVYRDMVGLAESQTGAAPELCKVRTEPGSGKPATATGGASAPYDPTVSPGGAAPSPSPLRNPQGGDKHGDRHSESKGGQR